MKRTYQNQISMEFDNKNLRINFPGQKVWVGGKKVKLSGIENLLLLVLALHPGQPIPNDQILDTIWGRGEGYPDLLRVNILRLRRKIEFDPSKPRYIKNRHGCGYYLDVLPS
jgi:DNA-binding response OmpR family regulator